MDHAMFAISIERFARAARGELARGFLLPGLALAADFGDFDMG